MASNNALKKAAKLYQDQHPGIPYPQARRIVSQLADFHPLTATISAQPDGTLLRLNLEESALLGVGPHCGITGQAGAGKTHLLAVMGRSLLKAPPTRGVEMAYFGDDEDSYALFDGVAQTHGLAELADYLDDLLAGRDDRLRKLGQPDWRRAAAHPAVVVMIDDLPWPSKEASAVEAALRVGRALDVHLIVATQEATPPKLAGHMPSLIHLAGEQAGHGTWKRCGDRSEVVDTELRVPPIERL